VIRENARVARKNTARRWNDMIKIHERLNTTSVITFANQESERYFRKRIPDEVERGDISNSSRSRMAKIFRVRTEQFSG